MKFKAAFSLTALLLSSAAMFSANAEPAPAAKSGTVLITGSNRGIGLEFVRQYAAAGWKVIATTRDPKSATELAALAASRKNIIVEPLDVADNTQINVLAAKYKGQPIDVLLNNAGTLGDADKQSLNGFDYANFENVLHVNTYAPLAIARAFLDNVLASEQKKIVAITSGLSSIANTQRFGSLYFYRISKVGLNMAMRTLQAELRGKGVKVGILAPGVVETRLLRQSGYRGPGVITPEQSVTAVIANIAKLDQTAEITLYNGDKVPW